MTATEVVPEIAPEAPTRTDPGESTEDAFRRSAKPPADGPCRGCGKNRPLNRTMLCFPCWVKKNLLDWSKASGGDWIPGDAHPAWCHCGLPEHAGGGRTVEP